LNAPKGEVAIRGSDSSLPFFSIAVAPLSNITNGDNASAAIEAGPWPWVSIRGSVPANFFVPRKFSGAQKNLI